ncbi:UNVERIFIED_CONTAM: hypothetical protein NCL1_15056 [Trichonephila clavipes]
MDYFSETVFGILCAFADYLERKQINAIFYNIVELFIYKNNCYWISHGIIKINFSWITLSIKNHFRENQRLRYSLNGLNKSGFLEQFGHTFGYILLKLNSVDCFIQDQGYSTFFPALPHAYDSLYYICILSLEKYWLYK